MQKLRGGEIPEGHRARLWGAEPMAHGPEKTGPEGARGEDPGLPAEAAHLVAPDDGLVGIGRPRAMASGSGGSMASPMAGRTSEMRLIHRSWIGESISPKPAAVPASISRISLDWC